jgi:hypothetical protein
MKRITNGKYEKGMESLMIFSDMLRDSLEQVMPGVRLRCESAYSWRGYQIMKYPGLKDSQYYCQIYFGESFGVPYVLEFCEYYEMTHKPFLREYNLNELGFFSLQYEAQKDMLIKILKKAVQEALKWNKSPERMKIVPKRLQ